MNENPINLFRFQRRFAEYLISTWPWMVDKKDVYTSELEYKFGADIEEILRTDAEIIVDKFFWPKKELKAEEYQECLDLMEEMVLKAWERMYSHLLASEKCLDMEYLEQKHEEFLETLHK